MNDLRTAPDAELGRWEAQAVAIEAHADLCCAESIGRVETHRRLVQAAASRIRRLLARTEELRAPTHAEIEHVFNGLVLTLAAVRPGDRASFLIEASPVADAVRAFDAVIDRAAEEGSEELAEDLGILARDFVATTDAFAAELAAAQWPLLGAGAAEEDAGRQRRRQELQREAGGVEEAIRCARLPSDDPVGSATHAQVAAVVSRLRQTFQRHVAAQTVAGCAERLSDVEAGLTGNGVSTTSRA